MKATSNGRQSATRRADADSLDTLLAPFTGDGELGIDAYRRLFVYFVEGWERHRSPLGSLVEYPGWPSWSGESVDQFEGFSRVMPLFGAWVAGGRSPIVKLRDGRAIDLASAFRTGLLAGTDPASPEYWGDMGDGDQRIVEAADIALALWFFRSSAWSSLGVGQKERVVQWLSQANARTVPDNNWHLFVITVNAVLRALGKPLDSDSTDQRYRRLKDEFYRGAGWFSDGREGSVDYYNAWAFHYSLYWLEQIRPTWDPDFIREARCRFLETYPYLIGPQGFPVLGRSVCYRLAVAAPLVFGHSSCPTQVSAGQAKRALDETWRYFIRRGAVTGGNVTQGYFGPDRRILENYSGPGSCLWSLRSLIPAYWLPWQAPFWQVQTEPLPVEKESYCVNVPSTGWTIRGDRESRVITVEPGDGSAPDRIQLRRYGLVRRILAAMYRTPQRPDNYEAKYGQRVYRSDPPFCASRRSSSGESG